MHTATIVTTVQLIDAMSPALGMIQNAQALVAQGFLKIRNAADRAFDTSAAAAFQAKLDGIGASLERVAQQADLSAAESSYERLTALVGELENRLNRIGGQSGGSGGGSGGDSGGDSDGKAMGYSKRKCGKGRGDYQENCGACRPNGADERIYCADERRFADRGPASGDAVHSRAEFRDGLFGGG